MKIEAKGITKATKKAVWTVWCDVERWSNWDSDVEWAKLFGEFTLGVRGEIKNQGSPKGQFTIIECSEQSSFTNRAQLPLATMDFIHTMEQTPQGLEITHSVVFKGLLAPLWRRVIGRNIARGLQHSVDNLIKYAEDGV